MLDYDFNEMALISRPNNPFSVMGEVFKATIIAKHYLSRGNIVVVESLNLIEEERGTNSIFAVPEAELFDIFDKAEDTIEEMLLPDFNNITQVNMSDLEKHLFGKELTPAERTIIAKSMGVEWGNINNKHELIGGFYSPIENIGVFNEDTLYKLVEVAKTCFQEGTTYVFETDSELIAYTSSLQLELAFKKLD